MTVGHPPQKPFTIAVLLSGRGSNFESILRAIQAKTLPAQVTVVLSDKADAPGLAIAAQHGIKTVVCPRKPKEQSATQFNEQIRAALLEAQPDLVVLAGYMRVLGDEVIAAFPNRIVNIHPSLLPSFPGLEAQKQALEAGVRFSGCTVHFVVSKVDAGPIIAQACVPVLPGDTPAELSARILQEEHRLYPAVLRRIVAGAVRVEGGRAILTDTPTADGTLRSLE